MRKYNPVSELTIIQQRLCNLIEYILFLYEKKYISERTKNELLKRINPDVDVKGGEDDETRRYKNIK